MKKIIFAIVCIFFSVYVWAQDFCSTYSPVWYNGFDNSQPSFADLKNFITNSTLQGQNFTYFNLNGQRIEGEHSVYLPYGTTKVKFAIAHDTTVATYLMKIDGTPSETDVDTSTSPYECIQQDEQNSICPYTEAIYDLYGDDVLIEQVKEICPNFNQPNLLCSRADTLWQGGTFNAVENTAILSVPDDFWNNHPNGTWLVYSWRGGQGGYAIGITVDKNVFDSWYDSLSEEQKQSSITCPLDESNTVILTIPVQIERTQIQGNNTLMSVTLSVPQISDENGTTNSTSENRTTYTYIWDFGDGTTNSTTFTEITHEYGWDDIVAAGNFLECKVNILDEQNAIIGNGSILIFGLNGKIRNDISLENNDIVVEISDPWKLLLWIKTQQDN